LYRLYEGSAWLLGSLQEARIDRPPAPPDPVRLQKFTLDGREDLALFEHPASRVTFDRVVVPLNGQLIFATAIAPSCQAMSAGAHFGIEVQGSGVPVNVFSREMRPKVNAADRHWIDGLVDLSPWNGQVVSISLETALIDGDYNCAWALWRDVVIDTSQTPFARVN
jgi:hypothetical protein